MFQPFVIAWRFSVHKYSLSVIISQSSTITVILACTVALLCYPYLISILILILIITDFWALASTSCDVSVPARRSSGQMMYSQGTKS